MTTFDRAFIKAFTDAPAHAGAAPGQAVAPPHGAPAKSSVRLGGSPSSPDELGETVSHEISLDATQPLSTFTAQPKLQDTCRALLEVDRFQWPAAAGELLTRAGREWQHFGQQLVEQMGSGHKCVALTGVCRGEGRTTITLTLAKHLATRGLRTLAVDADCQHPEMAILCRVSVHTGWDDLVNSELIIGESLIAAVEEGVTLLPWRTSTAIGKALPAARRVTSIFGSLRDHYDLILIDTGPLLGRTAVTDFAAFSRAAHVDAIYLVDNLRLPSRTQLSETYAKLQNAGLPVAGMIENFVSETRPPARSAQQTSTSGRPGHVSAARLAD